VRVRVAPRLVAAYLIAVGVGAAVPTTPAVAQNSATPSATAPVRTMRLHGVVEPVSSYAVTTPRLSAGQAGPAGQLIIVYLARSGTVVRKGDRLVEFDRHNQLKAARDREAEYRDFLQQIRKKQAEQHAARAKRQTELLHAQNAIRTAELDLLGLDFLPKIQTEKNQQALEEARAHFKALQTNGALRDRVDTAELRMLEIQRDRAMHAWRNAQRNAERMAIASPIDGLVVLKSIWKSGTMAVMQEGEEVRAGIPVLDVVDPSAMRVRALVNQADVERLEVGRSAKVTLDSLPARSFDARLEQLSPVATTSTLNARIRSFVATFSIAGSDPQLLPDLAAAIDILPVSRGTVAGGASR
jgi:HlyD family secretion protein